MSRVSILREIVDIVDIVIMIFGIIGSVGGFVFWWDSLTIREKVDEKLDNYEQLIQQEVKNAAIAIAARMQRRQDSNTVRISTVEEEIEQLKSLIRCCSKDSKCIDSIEPTNLSKISHSIDNTDFT
ncbi:MAG: hypothetical protein MUE44_34670 [Oscillatoriaceae cyanobacterium Prado104]|jgi:hypothetical protein|nr:hypothetical protein [Oscillatoriaceae cyanobacterium Prado104]